MDELKAKQWTIRTWSNRSRKNLLSILTLALFSRLIVMWIVFSSYPNDWLFSKTPDLALLALSISSGHGLSSPFGGFTGPSAFVAPGYPVMLSLIFRMFGPLSTSSAITLVAIQILFAVLTVAAMMRLGMRLFGQTTANIAGVYWSVSLPLIWLPLIPWESSLSALFLTAAVVLALRCVEKPSVELWGFTGAYCGLAMLVNPSLTLALLAILGWSAYHLRSGWRYSPVLAFILLLAVYAPWPIRNAVVLHSFIPFRSNFGYELWQGNHSGGNGNFDGNLAPPKNREQNFAYGSQGELIYMQGRSLVAINSICSMPGRFALLSAQRVVRFWTGSGSNVNSGYVEAYAVSTSVLGILGLVLLFKRNRPVATLFLLPLVLLPLPYYLTHADFRFRVLLDPLLTILAAYFFVETMGIWRVVCARYKDQSHD